MPQWLLEYFLFKTSFNLTFSFRDKNREFFYGAFTLFLFSTPAIPPTQHFTCSPFP